MKEEKRFISSDILFSIIKEQLDVNRQAIFGVTGMSMWPFLCHGRDQVIVEKCERNHLRKGDIVLFQTPLGNYMLHRITSLNEHGFETTGDGNCFRDGTFSYECIVAKVSRLVRPEKTIDCNDQKWKLIFRIWMFLFPIRKYIFAFWFCIRKYVKSDKNE